jgi:glucose-1-phosphate cytidylyltransferase
MLKAYFDRYFIYNSDYIVDLTDGSRQVINGGGVDWRVGVIDTGLETMTGGRLLRLRKSMRGGTFMVTYGDGVGDVDIRRLAEFHQAHGKVATVTAVRIGIGRGVIRFTEEDLQTFMTDSRTCPPKPKSPSYRPTHLTLQKHG